MYLKLVWLVSFLCTLPQNGDGKIQARIYGAALAIGEDFSFTVSITVDKTHVCGGTALSRRAILTACHCVHRSDPRRLQVRVGSKFKSSGGRLFGIEIVACHPDFDITTNENNIAMLRVTGDIDESLGISTIDLPRRVIDLSIGTTGIVSGWGLAENGPSEYLHYAPVKIVNPSVCQKYFSENEFSERLICTTFLTSGTGLSRDDAGGPFVVNGTVMGIMMWTSDSTLTLPREPITHLRVSPFLQWIHVHYTAFISRLN